MRFYSNIITKNKKEYQIIQNSVIMPGFQNTQNNVKAPQTQQTQLQNNTASNLQNQTATVVPSNNEDNKKKKIALALAALAAAGAAAIGITYAVKHHKKPEIAEPPIEILSNDKLIENIKKAKEEGFTGVIKGLLKNDDTVELTYENGKIVKSAREGAKNFVKEYSDNGVKTYDATGTVVSELQKTENGHIILNRKDVVTKYAKIDDNTHRVIYYGPNADPYNLDTEIINEYAMKDGKILTHKKIGSHSIDTYYKDNSSSIYHKTEIFYDNGNLGIETQHGNFSHPDVDFISKGGYYRPDGTLRETYISNKDGTFISNFFSEDGKQINKTIEERNIAPMADGWTSKEFKITENGQTRYQNIHQATGSNVKITEEFDSNKKFTGKTKETIKHRKEGGKTYTDAIIEKFDADDNLLNTETKSAERNFIDLINQ